MTTRPPADTHDRGQRGSRPVPFDPACELWRGAADGLIVSDDLNARLEFEPPEAASARTMPPPAPALLPFQRQEPSLAATMRSPWASPRTTSPPPPPPAAPPRLWRPPAGPPPGRRRAPCRRGARSSTSPTCKLLARELRALEQENVVLRKHAALQDKVIAGMCNLQVFERENRRRTSSCLAWSWASASMKPRAPAPRGAVLALGQDRGDLDGLARLLAPLEPPHGRPGFAPRQHQPIAGEHVRFLW